MRVRHLGPHSFISPDHSRNRPWLTSFTPQERRQLIDEDVHARWEIAGVMAGIMTLGILIAIVVFLVAL